MVAPYYNQLGTIGDRTADHDAATLEGVTLTWVIHVPVGLEAESCGIEVSQHVEFIFTVGFGW